MTAAPPGPGRAGGGYRLGVAVPAAGSGRRMGGVRKPWLELAGEPLILHALRPFLEHPSLVALRVALSPDEAADPPRWLAELDPRVALVAGGETRAHSVREAVRALPDVDLIMVHDAARPLVTGDVIDRCAAALLGDRGELGELGDRGDPEAREGREGSGAVAGAVAGWPATDTLKRVDGRRVVVETPDRSRLWHAQTPQAFLAAPFRAACERLETLATAHAVTDDASLAEADGLTVVVVEGSPRNLKVTRPADLPLAELFLGMRDADASRSSPERDGGAGTGG